MDLNTITAVDAPRTRGEMQPFGRGDAWLAGGTWLFSEPQPQLSRLIDLNALGWTNIEAGDAGLSIAATCPIAALDAFEAPAAWRAAPLIGQCCAAFLASFKIWDTATVGGNICLGLPAGPMISLATALDAACLVWTPDGGERRLAVTDLVTGPVQNALEPGEVLRAVELPADALMRRTAFRRISLTPLGRSGALLIGTLAESGRFALTVTASTRRPLRLDFDIIPETEALQDQLARAIPFNLYYDDMHGRPNWRRHMTQAFAEEIRRELDGVRP